jgi:hypothetical protein
MDVPTIFGSEPEMRPEFVGENDDVIFACDTFFGEEVATEEEGPANIL